MRNLVQILIFLTCPLIFAQLPQNMLKSSKKITKFDKYAGSIYAEKEFKKASVIDENSQSYDLSLNYNVYTDAVEYQTKSDLFEINKMPSISVRIGDDFYYYCDFKNERGLSRKGYYILVESNESYRIYKKHSAEIIEPKEQENMPGTFTMGKVKLSTAFYLEKNEVVTELPMNKKAILVAFSDQESAIKEYMKKEKIKIKKEEDLLRLVARYNALKNIHSNQSQSLLSSAVPNN